MKIRSLHFKDAGPLGTQTIALSDDWEGDVEDLVLFTGPNGCGKSTVITDTQCQQTVDKQ